MKFITFIVFAGMALAQGNRPPAAPPPPATVDDGSTVTITGNLVVNPIATQPAPTLQVLGTAGASTCTYSVVAKNSGGGIAGGAPTASVANCAATLSTSQAVSIKTAATIGATNCDVYRTAGHTSTGKIANVACGSTVVDIGLAGDGASAPATNNTGSFNLLGGGGTPTFAGLQVNGNANVTGNLSVGNTVLAQKGALVERVLANDGYALSAINTVGIATNQLVTYNGKQYAVYYNTALYLTVLVRTLSTGALASYVTTFQPDTGGSNDDEHRVASLGIDKNGYLHLVWGMHSQALNYVKSTSTEDPSAWTSKLSMLGTNEASDTYPMFMTHPSTHELYFTFRSGSSNSGDQYLYHYNAAGAAWEAASGTSTAGLIILAHTASPATNAYLNGAPKWDSNNNLWFAWSWGTAGTNQLAMYWSGSAFFSPTGTPQTIPATPTNSTVIATGTYIVQQSSCLDAANHLFVPYTRLDSNSVYQVYVLDNYTGSFVERQLTYNITPSVSSGLIESSVQTFSMSGWTYVMWMDAFSVERGIAVAQSSDGFATWRKFYLPKYSPNSTANIDWSRVSSGVISFLWMDANAYYGTSPVYTGTGNRGLGKLSIIDWTPTLDTGESKGLPTDLYGVESVNANLIYASNLRGIASQFRFAGYEVGTENASVALTTSDLTNHAIAVNDAIAKNLAEASCISDAGDQVVSVKIGSTLLFSIHCVSPSSYNPALNGTAGRIPTGQNMIDAGGSIAVAATALLDLSGTANGTTKDIKLFIYAVNQ